MAGADRRLRAAALALLRFTTRGTRGFADVDWAAGDWLVFGSESAGLPTELRERLPAVSACACRCAPRQRSLNLSNAVAVAVFEAWRQCGYAGAPAIAETPPTPA